MSKPPTYRSKQLPERCCGTCLHASFSLTEKGNFHEKRAGHCSKELQIVAPACVDITQWRKGIWPDAYADCPTWEQK